jgi:hypothetical protein
MIASRSIHGDAECLWLDRRHHLKLAMNPNERFNQLLPKTQGSLRKASSAFGAFVVMSLDWSGDTLLSDQQKMQQGDTLTLEASILEIHGVS